MKHGKHAQGFRSMSRLRAHPIIAARDFYYSWIIYEEELRQARGAGYFARLWDCFAVPRIRRANYGASTVMIAQQMCGINSMSLLSPQVCFHNNTLQSSRSTVRPSSNGSDILLRRRSMLLLVTVLFKSSLPFLRCSSSTQKVDEH